jgi:hypothetical protein
MQEISVPGFFGTNVMTATNGILPASSVRRPIEFLTENGFSISRLCEINNFIPSAGLVQRFLVRDPDGFELEITVEIDESVARALVRRSRGRVSTDSSYWVCCAERHLANYLWENDDFPPDASLSVDQPILDDIDFAQRWGRET